MLAKLVTSIIIGVVVGLVCFLLGTMLITMPFAWVAAIGVFLKTFAGLLGLLAALWHFFVGFSVPAR